MSAKANILARLKSAKTTPIDSYENRAVLNDFWQYSNAEKVDRFEQMLQAAHAEVYRVSRNDWAETLAGCLAEKQIQTLVTGTGFDELKQIDQACVGLKRIEFDQSFESIKADLFHTIPAGFTRSEGGIAATGSIILRPGPKEPRTLSLIPPVHFVLVDGKKIYNNLDQTMKEQAWNENMPTNQLLISGPSKTADIQQTLAYGAHGPKTMVVLLITD